jgi:hypothetical protein
VSRAELCLRPARSFPRHIHRRHGTGHVVALHITQASGGGGHLPPAYFRARPRDLASSSLSYAPRRGGRQGSALDWLQLVATGFVDDARPERVGEFGERVQLLVG